jgi:hypothetical protein
MTGEQIKLAGRRGANAFVICAVLMFGACNSKPSANTSRDGGERMASEATPPHVDVMCIGDKINDPPEAYHYSYKVVDSAGTTTKEADITSQAMDIAITDQTGTHTYHGVRSDDLSWNKAVLDLSGSGLTAMSARVSFLNDLSALKSQGPESINGYQTTKVAIDTTSATSSDRERYEAMMGKGAYDKGTIWAPADGCVVKLSLDEGIWQKDGSVKRVQFEMARVKK